MAALALGWMCFTTVWAWAAVDAARSVAARMADLREFMGSSFGGCYGDSAMVRLLARSRFLRFAAKWKSEMGLQQR
jgi:hypothetical protein